MFTENLPDLFLLEKKYSKKIDKIEKGIDDSNLIIYRIFLKGKFDNPLLINIERFIEEGKTKYIPTISHFFKNKIRPTFYRFTFESHDNLEKVFDDIYYIGLGNYEIDDIETKWTSNNGFAESAVK